MFVDEKIEGVSIYIKSDFMTCYLCKIEETGTDPLDNENKRLDDENVSVHIPKLIMKIKGTVKGSVKGGVSSVNLAHFVMCCGLHPYHIEVTNHSLSSKVVGFGNFYLMGPTSELHPFVLEKCRLKRLKGESFTMFIENNQLDRVTRDMRGTLVAIQEKNSLWRLGIISHMNRNYIIMYVCFSRNNPSQVMSNIPVFECKVHDMNDISLVFLNQVTGPTITGQKLRADLVNKHDDCYQYSLKGPDFISLGRLKHTLNDLKNESQSGFHFIQHFLCNHLPSFVVIKSDNMFKHKRRKQRGIPSFICEPREEMKSVKRLQVIVENTTMRLAQIKDLFWIPYLEQNNQSRVRFALITKQDFNYLKQKWKGGIPVRNPWSFNDELFMIQKSEQTLVLIDEATEMNGVSIYISNCIEKYDSSSSCYMSSNGVRVYKNYSYDQYYSDSQKLMVSHWERSREYNKEHITHLDIMMFRKAFGNRGSYNNRAKAKKGT